MVVHWPKSPLVHMQCKLICDRWLSTYNDLENVCEDRKKNAMKQKYPNFLTKHFFSKTFNGVAISWNNTKLFVDIQEKL